MLVILRNTNESFVAGDVVVTILECRNGRARIGIEAPPEIKIWRIKNNDDNQQTGQFLRERKDGSF